MPQLHRASSGSDLCTKIAQRHYENFPVGSFWISSKLRPHVHAIYAFARTADDFADEPEYEGVRLERLSAWREELYAAVKGRTNHPLFEALGQTIEIHQLPVQWLEDLISAFEQDVVVSRHPDFNSLLSYARLSANPVGRMILWIHGYRSEELFLLSDAVCTALQLTNFWQDVAVDWEKDRIYLPQADMEEFDYTEGDLANGILDNRFRGLLSKQISKTRDLFRLGRSLADKVGSDLKRELRLTWWGGARILERIEAVDYDVFKRRPRLKTLDKGKMLWRSLRWKGID